MAVHKKNFYKIKYVHNNVYWRSNVSVIIRDDELTVNIIGDFVSDANIDLLQNKITFINKNVLLASYKKIYIDFSLTYTSASSEMLIYRLCKSIYDKKKDTNCEIIWRYNNEYPDILELGKIIKETCRLNFNFVEDNSHINTFNNVIQFAEIF